MKDGWYILGKGHHYNPEGFVYLWPDGVWSSLANEPYATRELAEASLHGYKEGPQ